MLLKSKKTLNFVGGISYKDHALLSEGCCLCALPHFCTRSHHLIAHRTDLTLTTTHLVANTCFYAGCNTLLHLIATYFLHPFLREVDSYPALRHSVACTGLISDCVLSYAPFGAHGNYELRYAALLRVQPIKNQKS